MVGILENLGMIYIDDFNQVDLVFYNICFIWDNVE